MTRLWRTTLTLLLLGVVLAVPATAAERKPGVSGLAVLAAQAWQRIAAPLAALWAKSGGAMDPDGKPLPPPPPPTRGDSGGAMDPDGQPR